MQGHYTPSMAFGMCIRCHLFVFYFFLSLFAISFLLPLFSLHMLFCYLGHRQAAKGDSDINNRRATHIRNQTLQLVCVTDTITDGDKRLTMNEMGLYKKKTGGRVWRALEIASPAKKG